MVCYTEVNALAENRVASFALHAHLAAQHCLSALLCLVQCGIQLVGCSCFMNH